MTKALSFNHWWLVWLVPVAAFAAVVFSMSDTSLLWDWLSSEIGHLVAWWFIVTLAGVAVLPMLFRLLPALADRGYGLARLAGLMLITFVFWFLTSLGFLQNAPGAVATAWVIVLLASVWAWSTWSQRPSGQDWRTWLKEHWPYLLMYEIVFLAALLVWGYLRAHNPELNSTEKPMEMAFINGVRNSVTFPPKDPWLSGYGISYYYMGYVMIASLADLSNVPTPMAFNLMSVMIFALTATGALSIGYNLVRSIDRLGRWPVGSRFAGIGTGLLGATFIVLMGHLGTALVELPYKGYAADVPLANSVVGNDYFQFWDVFDRSGPYYEPIVEDGVPAYRLLNTGEVVDTIPGGYVRAPDRDGDGVLDWDDGPPEDDAGFNWWQQSRLVHDRNLGGVSVGNQPIAEFPQFSFLLADNHPHVLALPFTMLMLGLALGLALRIDPLQPWEVLVYGIIAGGMIFLNSWDTVYVLILVAAEFLRRLFLNGSGRISGMGDLWGVFTLQKRAENNVFLLGPVWLVLFVMMVWRGVFELDFFGPIDLTFQAILALLLAGPVTLFINWLLADTDWSGVVRFGIWLGIIFAVLYYPWIDSFSSQANGFYPNIVNPTRSAQYFLQFGIFVLLLTPFVIWQAFHARSRLSWSGVLTVVIAGLILLISVPVMSAFLIEVTCPIDDAGIPTEDVANPDTNWACAARSPLYGELSNAGPSIVYSVLERRTIGLVSQVGMLILLGIITMRLFPMEPRHRDPDRNLFNMSPTTAFALLLIAGGIVASLVPDVLYLRDNFSTRINTVFKLYYQAWLLLSIGTAYAVYAVLSSVPMQALKRAVVVPSVSGAVLRASYGMAMVVLVAMGLTYPYFGLKQHYLADSGRIAFRNNCTDTNCSNESVVTLDGTQTLMGAYATHWNLFGVDISWTLGADEFAVMQCLHEKEGYRNDAVLLEASGGGYDPALGRFSMYTGIPTLLGWNNHEEQWRGDSYAPIVLASGRLGDIHIIYQSLAEEWQIRAAPLIERYGIDYVVVGRAERLYYSDEFRVPVEGLAKFDILFEPVCQEGDTAVYRVSPE